MFHFHFNNPNSDVIITGASRVFRRKRTRALSFLFQLFVGRERRGSVGITRNKVLNLNKLEDSLLPFALPRYLIFTSLLISSVSPSSFVISILREDVEW